MLKIRLQRIGRRHDPKFRVLVTDSRRGPKSNNFVESVGSYDAKMGEVVLDAERIKYWLSVGAQPSDTVHNFLITHKIIEGKKINALPKKTPIVAEVDEEEESQTPTADASTDTASDDADTPSEDDTKKDEEKKEEAESPAAEAEEKPAEE